MRLAPTCPRCGSADVVSILYGMPTAEAFEEAERGELGGHLKTRFRHGSGWPSARSHSLRGRPPTAGEDRLAAPDAVPASAEPGPQSRG
jgi:hypothetical protein